MQKARPQRRSRAQSQTSKAGGGKSAHNGNRNTASAAKSLVDRVLVAVGNWILSGRYKPGETLPTEQEICRQLGVGRNAMREAIKMLVSKGFVRTERRAGMKVEPRSNWNMLDPAVLSWTLADQQIRDGLLEDLTRMRFIIEPEVAALAAEHATVTEILRIFEAYEGMERNAKDAALAIEADIAFHALLFEAAHNQLLSSIVKAFALLLRANFGVAIHAENGFIRNLEEHKRVAEAVHSRDPEAARRAMKQLLENNQRDLAKMQTKDERMATTRRSARGSESSVT